MLRELLCFENAFSSLMFSNFYLRYLVYKNSFCCGIISGLL